MDKVAGFLEVGRTEDTHQVVIRPLNLTLDADGTARLVFSPRHARYLANLLTEHAACAEEEAARAPVSEVSRPPRTRATRLSQTK